MHRPIVLALVAAGLAVAVATVDAAEVRVAPVTPARRVGARGSTGSTSTVAPTPRSYRRPVDAPVSDPFRAPSSPYGPGNRGIEYATPPGTPATSIGPGVVTFAGPVAGRGVVTVSHPDGLRSSLTGLASVAVAVGDHVGADTVLGTTTARLHLGVRRGSEYLDPETLFEVDATGRHAVLVPVPEQR